MFKTWRTVQENVTQSNIKNLLKKFDQLQTKITEHVKKGGRILPETGAGVCGQTLQAGLVQHLLLGSCAILQYDGIPT